MKQRVRISGELVKKYEDDICFMIKVDHCIMEVVEPREEKVEPMGYEVVNDMIIGYASTLLASPLDPKEKRIGTYSERINPIVIPKQKKGKVVPSTLTLVTSVASPKVTRRSPTKKKPEAILPKVFERKRKTKNEAQDSGDTESKEEIKKTRKLVKKTKLTGNVSTTSALVNIDISSYKPTTHSQRTIKNIRRKVLDDLKEYFDDFNDSEKEDVEQELIKYLCDNDWSPTNIKSVTSKYLYDSLDNK